MKAILAIAIFAAPAPVQAIDLLSHYDAPKVQKASAPKHAAKPKPRPKSKPKPYAYRAPPKDLALASEQITRCLAPVRVVGSQDVRESAAEESAKKAWMERVRFESGEMFQDIGNAQSYAKRCVRSSIGEALGQYFHRCEVEALPCRPGMTEGVK